MTTIKQFLTSKLNLVRFSAQVFVMGAIVSLTFFLLAIDSAKEYRSEISILVNAKSELAEKQSEKITANIIELPKTLSFYDRLLKFNPDVRDVTAGLTPDERKQKWNEMFSIEQVGQNSSVFKISIVAKREADAEQLAGKSARTLFDTVAFYYDIKNDVDLRIIDGPLSKSQVPALSGLLLLSIIGGFAFAVMLNFIFLVIKNRFAKGSDLLKKNYLFDFKKDSIVTPEKEIEALRNLYQNERDESPFIFEETNEEMVLPIDKVEKNADAESKFQEMKKITKKFEPGKYPNFSEMPIRQAQQPATVPDNLPVADETFFAGHVAPQETETVQKQVATIVEEEPVIDMKKEPTPEELKKRLNQLLRGEL